MTVTTPPDNRTSQLLKGVLDLCLLALLAEEPGYGYELVQKLAARGLALVSEGSIYPVLSRLQQRGAIEGYLVPSNEGPRRKYYRVLPLGHAMLTAGAAEWAAVAGPVSQMLQKGLP